MTIGALLAIYAVRVVSAAQTFRSASARLVRRRNRKRTLELLLRPRAAGAAPDAHPSVSSTNVCNPFLLGSLPTYSDGHLHPPSAGQAYGEALTSAANVTR